MATVKKSIALIMSLFILISMVFLIAHAGGSVLDGYDDDDYPPFETPTDPNPAFETPTDPIPSTTVPVDYDSIKDNTYTVKFDMNGAPGTAPSSISGNGGTSATVPSASYTGHSFLGWSESPDGANTIYAAGAKYVFVKNTTLYAVWEETIPNDRDNFDLRFEAEGGFNPPSAIRAHGNVRLPGEIPTREKYEFKGWKDKGTGKIYNSGELYELGKNTTLFAVWEPVNTTAGVEIHAVTETTVDYLSKVTIHATAGRFLGHNEELDIDEYDSLPEGYVLVITDTDDEDNIVATGNRDEVVFYIDEINRERHFAVSVIQEGAKIVDPERDADGIELTMPVNIRVRDCLLDRLLAAVRKLFGLLPIVTIGPTERDFTTYYGPGFFATIINKLSGIGRS